MTPNEMARLLGVTAPEAARVLLGLEPLGPAAIECLCRSQAFEWRTKFAAAVAICRVSGAIKVAATSGEMSRRTSICGCAHAREVANLPDLASGTRDVGLRTVKFLDKAITS